MILDVALRDRPGALASRWRLPGLKFHQERGSRAGGCNSRFQRYLLRACPGWALENCLVNKLFQTPKRSLSGRFSVPWALFCSSLLGLLNPVALDIRNLRTSFSKPSTLQVKLLRIPVIQDSSFIQFSSSLFFELILSPGITLKTEVYVQTRKRPQERAALLEEERALPSFRSL